MDDAFDFAVIVDNGEIGEAGFIELVESEGAENFLLAYENHFILWHHEVADFFVVETHDGGDATAILVA